MRTFKQYEKEFQEAHTCEKCEGKIILIEFDGFNQHCGYCHTLVNYPRATKEELLFWMKEKNDPNLNKLMEKLRHV